jgi:ABC-type glycerol-3-phosphate transport system permease component
MFSKFLEWMNKFNFKLVLIIITVIFLVGIIYVLYKLFRLKRKWVVSWADFFVKETPTTRVSRWDEIKKRMDSENFTEWRMAIIEADSLLDEIIKKIGYKGENFGERLKSIEPSDFDNIQNVWEAHKIRNRIVHDVDKFVLTKEEVKETLEKYEKALKELKYI